MSGEMAEQDIDDAITSGAGGDEGSESALSDLLVCPCGQVPDCLDIVDVGQGGKWAYAVPGCCGEWTIEFRTQYSNLGSEECMGLAIEAWNDAPRAN